MVYSSEGLKKTTAQLAFRLNFYWKMYIQIYILEKTRNSVVFVSFLISSIYACTIDRRVDFKATDTRAGVGVPAIVWSRVISEAGTCSAEIQTVLKSFSFQSIFHFSFNIATLTAGKSEADRVLDKIKFDKSVFRILRQAWLNFFREEKANILQADCQPLIFLAQRKYSDQIYQLKDARLAGQTKFL